MDSEGPRAREGHHHPRQEHRRALRRHRRAARRRDHQHHRHPRPRRLRRRGRARPVDGRRRRAARRRLRGPAAADPVRAAQGARRAAAGHPRASTRWTGRTRASPRSSTRPTSCSWTSTPTEEQIDFPIVYASARAGRASLNRPEDGGLPDSEDLEPLFRTILDTIPAPTYDDEAPLQAHVTNLDASPFLGRLALCRVHQGTIRKGQHGRLVPGRRHASSGSRSPSC